MKKIVPFLLLFISISSFGQNLVVNGSFEDTLCTPSQFNVFAPFASLNWYSPTTGTPDFIGDLPALPSCYFINIYNPGLVDYGDWQYPQDGLKMAGIYCHNDVFCIREYLQARISTPLDGGKDYCLSFYVALRNSSNRAIDRIGACFTNDSIVDFSGSCIANLQPYIESPSGIAITDTLNWTLISGVFTAQGGESFITLGNFTPQSEQYSVSMNGFGDIPSAYYYIDNIVLEQCLGTSMEEDKVNKISLFPNPVSFQLQVQSSTQLIEAIKVFNTVGQLVYTASPQQNSVLVETNQWATGLYVLEVATTDGFTKSFEVLKE